uniref:Chemokine interleukin-8-like domain-containing protein n=1 Tax=Pseudonaja textilis TaxID=8673 RepID=A0A670YLS8_PSETE
MLSSILQTRLAYITAAIFPAFFDCCTEVAQHIPKKWLSRVVKFEIQKSGDLCRIPAVMHMDINNIYTPFKRDHQQAKKETKGTSNQHPDEHRLTPKLTSHQQSRSKQYPNRGSAKQAYCKQLNQKSTKTTCTNTNRLATAI